MVINQYESRNRLKKDWVMVVGHHPIYTDTPKDESELPDMQNTLGKVLGKYPKVAMYLCGHIHNFQHICVPDSSIDYVVNSSASKTLVRSSVSLLVLITDYLLLPVKMDSVEFYKKQLPRILYPFFFIR